MKRHAAPLELLSTSVAEDWIDHNGHMFEGYHGVVFGKASDELTFYIGFDDAYHRATGCTFYTVETHTVFVGEAKVHTPLAVRTTVLGADTKRLHLFHEMRAADTDDVVATQETMMLHVDQTGPKVAPMPEPMTQAAVELVAAHGELERPSGAGRAIRSLG